MSNAQLDPLGNGIVCPFRFTSKQDFVSASGKVLVRSDVGELVGIEKGEIFWRPDLGTPVSRLRHRANTQAIADLARVDVARALARYEPRVRLRSVTSPMPAAGSPSKRELSINYEVNRQQDNVKTTI